MNRGFWLTAAPLVVSLLCGCHRQTQVSAEHIVSVAFPSLHPRVSTPAYTTWAPQGTRGFLAISTTGTTIQALLPDMMRSSEERAMEESRDDAGHASHLREFIEVSGFACGAVAQATGVSERELLRSHIYITSVDKSLNPRLKGFSCVFVAPTSAPMAVVIFWYE